MVLLQETEWHPRGGLVGIVMGEKTKVTLYDPTPQVEVYDQGEGLERFRALKEEAEKDGKRYYVITARMASGGAHAIVCNVYKPRKSRAKLE